jgi:hypothetical protein
VAAIPWIDVARFVTDAGFSGIPARNAIAIIDAESGRNPQAVNRQGYASEPLPEWPEALRNANRDPVTGLYWVTGDPNGGSFGLVQANGVHDTARTGGPHPHWKPTLAWTSRMFDPKENIAFMAKLSGGSDFSAWGTFTTVGNDGLRAYERHGRLTVATVALDGLQRIRRLETTLAARNAAVAERDQRIVELAAEIESLLVAAQTKDTTITQLRNSLANVGAERDALQVRLARIQAEVCG